MILSNKEKEIIFSILRNEEGVRKDPYLDHLGNLTIGVGHNLNYGLCGACLAAQALTSKFINDLPSTEPFSSWSDSEKEAFLKGGLTPRAIQAQLEFDVDVATGIAEEFGGKFFCKELAEGPKFRGLVLMAFQLGRKLFSFKKMRAAWWHEDWEGVKAEALNSKWAEQMKESGRAKRVAELFVQGD